MRYIVLLCLSLFLLSCSSQTSQKSVTVYVSEDQVFSEPVLKAFEKQTGIKVNAIYDTEESKSTGVMNRLIAEQNNPQADVYWANEPIRAEVLKQKGILEAYASINAKEIPQKFKEKNHFWTGFSARIRVLIVQKDLDTKPDSIMDYTDPKFASKSVIANPLFGTTTAHMAALFTIWGDQKSKTFLRQMKKNHVVIATSNGESADFVASQSYAFALVDSDDAVSRVRAGKEVEIIYPDQGKEGLGVFVVPNVAMLIKHAPHPKYAKQLIDYLLSHKSEEQLAFADCAQIPLHPNVPMPKELKSIATLKTMSVDFAKVAKKMIEIQPYLKAWQQH